MDKRVNFITETEGSYMDLVSTSYRPEIRIVYNKLLKQTKNLPDNVLNIADLIEVKGMKAQGNQITKLKVKEILLEHEIDGGEPWPEEEVVEIQSSESTENDTDDESLNEDGTTIEWDFTKPNDDLDESGQGKLF
jgi:topoisomerase-4 subunit A